MIKVANARAICSSSVKNYHVYDRCYVTGSNDVMRLYLFVMVHDVRTTIGFNISHSDHWQFYLPTHNRVLVHLRIY